MKYNSHSLFKNSLNVSLVMNFALVLQICSLAKFFNQFLYFIAAREDVEIVGSEVAGPILVQDFENVHNIVLQALCIDLFEHIEQEFLKVNSAILILVHVSEYNVHFLLVHIIAKSSQQELESAAGDIPGVVSVVHFEDLT